MAGKILVLDPDLAPCTAQGCERIDKVIEQLWPTGDMTIQTMERVPSKPSSAPVELVIFRSELDEKLPRLVERLRALWGSVPLMCVFCVSNRTSYGMLQCLADGVDDFLSCPLQRVELVPRMERLLRRGRMASARAARARWVLDALVGESESFLGVVEMVPRLASADATVLITGETGTGKELLARAVHYRSPRHGKPFVPLNCGTLPDNLIENELFGHTQGAFTGAVSATRGLVEEAEGGTLFLDEIDALSLPAQSKLLRFMQYQEYRPLGSSKSKVANTRVVAATNAELGREVREGRFREDLFYRLNVLRLHVPPLRERDSDILLLAAHFLKRYSEEFGRGTLRFSTGAFDKLFAYDWPGNVRELESVIQRAVLLSSGIELGPDEVELPVPWEPGDSEEAFGEAKARVIERFERNYLIKLLGSCRGNVTQAAANAGKERRALQRLLRKHGIDRETFVS